MKKHLLTTQLILTMIVNISFAQQSKTIDPTGWTVKINTLNTHLERTFQGGPNDIKHFHKLYEIAVKGLDKEEKARVEMSFNTTAAIFIDTITVAKGKHIFDNHSYLFSDCETYDFSPVYQSVGISPSATTPSSVVPSSNTKTKNDTLLTSKATAGPTGTPASSEDSQWKEPFVGTKNEVSSDIDKNTPAIEGQGSLYMQGTSAKSENGKYVCSLTRRIINNGTTVDVNLQSEENNTWFFFYVYGIQDVNATFQLMVTENDPDAVAGNTSSAKDYYLYDIPLDFIGWKQFAVKYSDMYLYVSGSTSDKVKNTANISSIDYRLLSKDVNKKVRVNIDYMAVLYSNNNHRKKAK